MRLKVLWRPAPSSCFREFDYPRVCEFAIAHASGVRTLMPRVPVSCCSCGRFLRAMRQPTLEAPPLEGITPAAISDALCIIIRLNMSAIELLPPAWWVWRGGGRGLSAKYGGGGGSWRSRPPSAPLGLWPSRPLLSAFPTAVCRLVAELAPLVWSPLRSAGRFSSSFALLDSKYTACCKSTQDETPKSVTEVRHVSTVSTC